MLLERAGNAGYAEMVLDTLEPFQAAIHLYKKFGFSECEPYYDNPMDDVIYMKNDLNGRGGYLPVLISSGTVGMIYIRYCTGLNRSHPVLSEGDYYAERLT